MAGSSSEGRPTHGEPSPSLDLFNFDRPEHQRSRYILTSPRSLRACAALGIKPVELLPQSQQELSRVCGDSSPRALTAIHREVEAQRRVKLQAARRERERIIAGQKSKNSGSERRSPHLMSRDFPTSLSRSMSVEWNQSSRERNEGSGYGLRSTAAAKGRGDLDITGLPEKDKRILATLSLRFSSEESQQREKAAALEQRWRHWERRRAQLATRAVQRAVEKKDLEDWKRRQQQEQQRRVQEEERELREEVREHSSRLQSRAAANRESIAHQRSLQKQSKLASRQLLHEHRKKELEAVAMEEEEERSRHLEARLSASADRYHLQQVLKKEHVRLLVEKEKQKANRRKEAAVKIETELEEWRKELEHFREESQMRAAEASERANWERMWRAHSERERHTQEHSQAIRRLQVEEIERQKQLEQEVEEKERKRAALHREKQLAIEKAREVSRASERARHQLKDHYLRTSFSWKMQEAEKFNKLHRPRTS